MSFTYLHGDVPVSHGSLEDPECYDWMAIRAGRPSRFCKEVTFGSDIVVNGTINHSGQFEPPLPAPVLDIDENRFCDQPGEQWSDQLIYPANNDLNQTLKAMSDFLLTRMLRFELKTPLVVALSQSLDLAPGSNTFPPVGFDDFEKVICTPNLAYNEELCPYDYTPTRDGTNRMELKYLDQSNQSLGKSIKIKAPGVYKMTLQLACKIEVASVPGARVLLYAIHPSWQNPSNIVGQVACDFSGTDTIQVNSGVFYFSVFPAGGAPPGGYELVPDPQDANQSMFDIQFAYASFDQPDLIRFVAHEPSGGPGVPAISSSESGYTHCSIECVSTEPQSSFIF